MQIQGAEAHRLQEKQRRKHLFLTLGPQSTAETTAGDIFFFPALAREEGSGPSAPEDSSCKVPARCRGTPLRVPSPQAAPEHRKVAPAPPPGQLALLLCRLSPAATAGVSPAALFTGGAGALPSPPSSPPRPWCSSRGCTSPSSPMGRRGAGVLEPSLGQLGLTHTGCCKREFCPPGPVGCGGRGGGGGSGGAYMRLCQKRRVKKLA